MKSKKLSIKIQLLILVVFLIYCIIWMTIDYGIFMGLITLTGMALLLIPAFYFIWYKKVWWVKMFIIYSIIVIIIAIVAVAISMIVNPATWHKH